MFPLIELEKVDEGPHMWIWIFIEFGKNWRREKGKEKKRNNPGCFDEMRIKKRKGLGSWGKFLHEGVLMLRNHVRACGFWVVGHAQNMKQRFRTLESPTFIYHLSPFFWNSSCRVSLSHLPSPLSPILSTKTYKDPFYLPFSLGSFPTSFFIVFPNFLSFLRS